MCRDIEHPEITMVMVTGYPSWMQENEDVIRCCECGVEIYDDEEVYECRTHETLCLDCLKMLHKKYL